MTPKTLRLRLQKDVARLASRIVFEGDTLSPGDRNLFAESLMLREYLIRDLFSNESSALAWRRALLSLQTIDAKAVFQALKEIYKILLSEVVLNENDWLPFKQAVHCYPLWIVAPLLRYLEGRGVDPESYSKALQWCTWDVKITLKSTPPSGEFEEYFDDEFIMKNEPINVELCEELNKILLEWCVTFPYEGIPFRGSHSNGTVTGLKRNENTPFNKTKMLKRTPTTESYIAFREVDDPFQTWSVDRGELSLEPLNPDLCQDEPVQVSFVPKDALKKRVVSPEDPMRMFLQGDAFEAIYQWMESFHWCNLKDQSLSRRYALDGSKDGSYATFDLSKASDFVRHSQLKIILRNTFLWNFYDLTRAKTAWSKHPTEKYRLDVVLEKACPMGSKVCFLMEQLVFALCCEYSVRQRLGRRSRRGDFLVYGDDIVIRHIFAIRLRFILSFMRYRVNDAKSFSEVNLHNFREACGIFAIDGKDITPLRISRRYTGVINILSRQKSSKAVDMAVPPAGETLGLIDFVNRLLVYGFVETRRVVLACFSGEEWARKVWRVTLGDYLSDVKRFKRGEKAIASYPTPTLLTPDHVDANYQLSIHNELGRHTKKLTGKYSCQILVTVTQLPKEGGHDSLDLFHWEALQMKTADNEPRETWRWEVFPPPLWELELLKESPKVSYRCPSRTVWRLRRHPVFPEI